MQGWVRHGVWERVPAEYRIDYIKDKDILDLVLSLLYQASEKSRAVNCADKAKASSELLTYHLHSFLMKNQSTTDLNELMSCSGSTYGAFRVGRYRYSDPNHSLLAFCASARLRKISLIELLSQLILYCEEKSLSIPACKGNLILVEKIHRSARKLALASLQGSESSRGLIEANPVEKLLSLQDVATLNSEIDKIRKTLGLYPYGKDRIKLTSGSKSTLTNTLNYVDQLLEFAPEHVELLSIKALILGMMNKKQEAIETAKQAYLIDPDSEKASIVYAIQLGSSEQLFEAKSVLWESRKKYPNSDAILYYLSVLSKNSGDYKDAIEFAKLAISIDANFARPYWIMYQSYVALNQLDATLPILEKLVEICPDDPKICMSLAAAKSIAGNHGQALELMEDVFSKNDDFLNFVKLIPLKENNLSEDLIESLSSIVENARKNPLTSKYNLATMLYILSELYGEIDDVERILQKECLLEALCCCPDHVFSLELLVKINFRENDFESAKFNITKLLECIKEYGDRKKMCFSLSYQADSLKYRLLPLQCLRECVGDDADILARLGSAYVYADEIPLAINYASQAFNLLNEDYRMSCLTMQKFVTSFYVAKLWVNIYDKTYEDEAAEKAVFLFRLCAGSEVKNSDRDFWIRSMDDYAMFHAKIAEHNSDIGGYKKAADILHKAFGETSIIRNKTDHAGTAFSLSKVYEAMFKISKSKERIIAAIDYCLVSIKASQFESSMSMCFERCLDLIYELFLFGKSEKSEGMVRGSLSFLDEMEDLVDPGKDFENWSNLIFDQGIVLNELYFFREEDELFLERAEEKFLKVLENNLDFQKHQCWHSVGGIRYLLATKRRDILLARKAISAYRFAMELTDVDEVKAHYFSCIAYLFFIIGDKENSENDLLDSISEYENYFLSVSGLDGVRGENERGMGNYLHMAHCYLRIYELRGYSDIDLVENAIENVTFVLSNNSVNVRVLYPRAHYCLAYAYRYKGVFLEDEGWLAKSIESFEAVLNLDSDNLSQNPNIKKEILEDIEEVRGIVVGDNK